ncbi:uncharacterized protein THITE_2127637 [Thermothielavioides terrestris NRRL 8126]|uniref:Uncharacterized protein n=1 Tax=Thermothielavioides terrestris (strain ATCC 38088 / NRRL 8126) TaxID=578455 RepID=G2QZ12_THETT|nr:uncharacterized protein THITE_2127637 [Thermothielavioides terrestris NRRL 8126]AEO65444.1 hypothetical protein THITE_2127637 [Thermothielavioides terrestris NRRL 8126]
MRARSPHSKDLKPQTEGARADQGGNPWLPKIPPPSTTPYSVRKKLPTPFIVTEETSMVAEGYTKRSCLSALSTSTPQSCVEEPIAATNPSTTVPSPPSVMPDLVTPNFPPLTEAAPGSFTDSSPPLSSFDASARRACIVSGSQPHTRTATVSPQRLHWRRLAHEILTVPGVAPCSPACHQ